jgi:aspartyl protease family protein
MTRLTVVFLILGIGLALLVFNHDSGETLGLNNDDFAHLVYLLPIAALLSAGVIAGRQNISETLRHMLIWLLIILALATAYLYRQDFAKVGNRLMAGLIPGHAVVMTTSEGGQEVILHKRQGGHFQASVEVDGKSVEMLIDTGASSVALAFEDAERLGLEPEKLNYTLTVMTANGRARAAPVRLQQIAIGPIIRQNIAATVAEKGRLEQSLLGMSFLATLGSLQMQTDELRMRD